MRLVLMTGLIVVGALTSLVYVGPMFKPEPLTPEQRQAALAPGDTPGESPAPAVTPPTGQDQPAEPRRLDTRPITEPSATDLKRLTVSARETFEAIFEAAKSGEVEALVAIAETASTAPVLANVPTGDAAPDVRRAFVDYARQTKQPVGELLRQLARAMSVAPAIQRRGGDVENNEIFIWPAISAGESAPGDTTAQHQFSVIFPPRDAARIAATGRYEGFAVVIAADGRWRALRFPPTIRAR